MSKILMTGWTEGLEKVTLTRLQMNLLQISLPNAKKNVDKLLHGEVVVIDSIDENKARSFINEASDIGVICHLEDF